MPRENIGVPPNIGFPVFLKILITKVIKIIFLAMLGCRQIFQAQKGAASQQRLKNTGLEQRISIRHSPHVANRSLNVANGFVSK